MSLNRRNFVLGCAASTTAALTLGAPALARTAPRRRAGVRITRIVAFDLQCKRNKVAGKNARLDVHGDSAVDPMVRIYTNEPGVEGIGVCRARKEQLAQLIGDDPLALFNSEMRRMRGPLGTQTMPLWDLVARMHNKPVYELLGGSPGSREVGVYDGSIYFADLLPEHASAWEDRFKREIDMGLAAGHRAFKIKVGRGSKWMPRDEGDARDVAVVQLIRAHAGKDVILGVDANNGYDLEGAKRFTDRTAEANLAFAEELFPEVVDQCLSLKEYYRDKKMNTLLADGETQGELETLKPFIDVKAIDVLQADMNHFGIEGIMTEAAWARPQGLRVAPHNWGSLLGFYQQLQIGMAIDNFYLAENDPLASELLIAEGFSIKNGRCTVPTTSGYGIRLNEERFAKDAKIKFELKA